MDLSGWQKPPSIDWIVTFGSCNSLCFHFGTWTRGKKPLFIEAGCLNMFEPGVPSEKKSYYLLVSKAGQDLRLTLLHDCTWFYTTRYTRYTRYTRFYAILHHFAWFYLILQYFNLFYMMLHHFTSLLTTINHYQHLSTTIYHYPLSTSWRPCRALNGHPASDVHEVLSTSVLKSLLGEWRDEESSWRTWGLHWWLIVVN